MNAPTYFWSGSNRAGIIAGLATYNQPIGIGIGDIHPGGLAVLLSLADRHRFVVGVTRSTGGAPILMFSRDRPDHAGLPSGDVPVLVGASRLVLGFRAIAVNVARALAGGVNQLAGLLRGLFGADAGARGAGHRVTFERTPEGWTMRREDPEDGQRPRVFVDSGAFRAFGRGEPITPDQWEERLDRYQAIADALGCRAYLVAPDAIGDQTETLRLLARYADRVRALRARGAQIIVPIQGGAMSGPEFDRECSAVLGFGDYIRGIPSRKAAATTEEIRELCAALPDTARVHLLGLGPWSPHYAATVEATGRQPSRISCDSVRLTAMVGRKGGKGGGPRLYTRLCDLARATLRIRKGAPGARVAYRAVALYFAEGHDVA